MLISGACSASPVLDPSGAQPRWYLANSCTRPLQSSATLLFGRSGPWPLQPSATLFLELVIGRSGPRELWSCATPALNCPATRLLQRSVAAAPALGCGCSSARLRWPSCLSVLVMTDAQLLRGYVPPVRRSAALPLQPRSFVLLFVRSSALQFHRRLATLVLSRS